MKLSLGVSAARKAAALVIVALLSMHPDLAAGSALSAQQERALLEIARTHPSAALSLLFVDRDAPSGSSGTLYFEGIASVEGLELLLDHQGGVARDTPQAAFPRNPYSAASYFVEVRWSIATHGQTTRISTRAELVGRDGHPLRPARPLEAPVTIMVEDDRLSILAPATFVPPPRDSVQQRVHASPPQGRDLSASQERALLRIARSHPISATAMIYIDATAPAGGNGVLYFENIPSLEDLKLLLAKDGGGARDAPPLFAFPGNPYSTSEYFVEVRWEITAHSDTAARIATRVQLVRSDGAPLRPVHRLESPVTIVVENDAFGIIEPPVSGPRDRTEELSQRRRTPPLSRRL